MLINDFHSKMVSGKEEGRLIEALRKLRKLENIKAMMSESTNQEAGAWNVWAEDETIDGGGSLAAAKA